MPSIYDHFTPEQLQAQILHTQRAARAKVGTVVAESKLRREQIAQAGQIEREAIARNASAVRQQSKEARRAEAAERVKSIKTKEEETVKQIIKTGKAERQFLKERTIAEATANIHVKERESKLRIRQMKEEHALKLELLKEESQARLRIMMATPMADGERSVMFQEEVSPKPSSPEVKQWSRMSTIMKQIDHGTGEVETSHASFDDFLVKRLEGIFRESTDEKVYFDTLTRTIKMPAGLDKSMELVSIYKEISKDNETLALDIHERVRELRVAPEMPCRHSAGNSRDDATIELTDSTIRLNGRVRNARLFKEESRRIMEDVRECTARSRSDRNSAHGWKANMV